MSPRLVSASAIAILLLALLTLVLLPALDRPALAQDDPMPKPQGREDVARAVANARITDAFGKGPVTVYLNGGHSFENLKLQRVVELGNASYLLFDNPAGGTLYVRLDQLAALKN